MLTKEQYAKIRNTPNFLYIYFLESGGKVENENLFNEALNIWLFQKGVMPPIGRKNIENFLDNKHQ